MRVTAGSALVVAILGTSVGAQSPPATPSISGPIASPGPLYTAVMDLPAEADFQRLNYVVKEFFVSGTANNAPYTTRILVRQPSDPRRFSGIVVAEGMHPSGYSWMFAFNRPYMTAAGHASLEIVTTPGPVVNANPERYNTLKVAPGQANEILAQVGALVKSHPANGPMGALRVRRLIMMGTSASARILANYLPVHKTYRMPDGGPIFDGYLPTSIGGSETLPMVDVPIIQMPTMTEVEAGAADGNKYRRPDGDARGDQFRIYEVAGMSHNDSRDNRTYSPDPCRYPVSQFPEGAGMSVGLHHLIAWVDKGTVAPRAAYIAVDGNKANDGSLLALDAHGNVKGGIRTTYVDLPLYRYGVPNEANPTPIPNPSSHVAGRQDGAAFYCRIAGYQTALAADQVKTLYKDKQDYRQQVERRLNQLIAEGWFVPAYKTVVLDDAAHATLP
jgi:hypothetical protein